MTEVRHRVVVYRTSRCPYCVAAEELLRARGLPLEQIYLDDHPDRSAFTESILPGHDTVPLILIDGRPIGGYRELSKLADSGELDELLG